MFKTMYKFFMCIFAVLNAISTAFAVSSGHYGLATFTAAVFFFCLQESK